MTGMALAAMLQLSAVTVDASYADAHKALMESGKPMVVLIGAEWCPACQTMKHSVMPEVTEQGGLDKVTYAVIDTDTHPTLAHKLMRGSSIPQLIVYRRTENGWRINRLIGSQSTAAVEQLVQTGLSDALAGPVDGNAEQANSVKLTANTEEVEVPEALKFTMKSLAGDDVELAQYHGRVLLVVNTASQCGYTPQYAGLEKLHEKYGEQGLSVLGFPCNQFGEQEPGSAEEIAKFCKQNYDVQFDMFAKVDVNGDGNCDLYKFLTAQETKPAGKGPIKWNFEKFLIGRDGQIIGRYASKVAPESDELVKAIESALEAK